MFKKILFSSLLCGAVAGCEFSGSGNYTTGISSATDQAIQTIRAEDVVILDTPPSTEYTIVKPIKVTVNKLTAFHPNPSVEQAELELKKEAAKHGANAIIYADIGDVTVGLTSWGIRTATGTAITY